MFTASLGGNRKLDISNRIHYTASTHTLVDNQNMASLMMDFHDDLFYPSKQVKIQFASSVLISAFVVTTVKDKFVKSFNVEYTKYSILAPNKMEPLFDRVCKIFIIGKQL